MEEKSDEQEYRKAQTERQADPKRKRRGILPRKKARPEGQINPSAFSKDGYIINQGILTDVPFGRRTTKQTGCGWIACFNFLKFMGKEEAPLKVAQRMEKMLLYGGYIGSHPAAVWWYLHRRGFRFRVAVTRRGLERALRASLTGRASREAAADKQIRTAGILMYRHKSGSHYAAFTVTESVKERLDSPRAVPRLRFLNAVYGAARDFATPREFFKRHVKFPLVLALVAR